MLSWILQSFFADLKAEGKVGTRAAAMKAAFDVACWVTGGKMFSHVHRGNKRFQRERESLSVLQPFWGESRSLLISRSFPRMTRVIMVRACCADCCATVWDRSSSARDSRKCSCSGRAWCSLSPRVTLKCVSLILRTTSPWSGWDCLFFRPFCFWDVWPSSPPSFYYLNCVSFEGHRWSWSQSQVTHT